MRRSGGQDNAAGTPTWSFRILYQKTSLGSRYSSTLFQWFKLDTLEKASNTSLPRVQRKDASGCGTLYYLQLFGVLLGMRVPCAYSIPQCKRAMYASFLQSIGALLRLCLMNPSPCCLKPTSQLQFDYDTTIPQHIRLRRK